MILYLSHSGFASHFKYVYLFVRIILYGVDWAPKLGSRRAFLTEDKRDRILSESRELRVETNLEIHIYDFNVKVVEFGLFCKSTYVNCKLIVLEIIE